MMEKLNIMRPKTAYDINKEKMARPIYEKSMYGQKIAEQQHILQKEIKTVLKHMKSSI